jgi:hypothetical protein
MELPVFIHWFFGNEGQTEIAEPVHHPTEPTTKSGCRI